MKCQQLSCYDPYDHQVGSFTQHAPLWQDEEGQGGHVQSFWGPRLHRQICVLKCRSMYWPPLPGHL